MDITTRGNFKVWKLQCTSHTYEKVHTKMLRAASVQPAHLRFARTVLKILVEKPGVRKWR